MVLKSRSAYAIARRETRVSRRSWARVRGMSITLVSTGRRQTLNGGARTSTSREGACRPSAGPGHTVRVSPPGPDRELLTEEERLWTELHDLVDALPRGKVEEPGYFDEGWS